MKKKLIANRKDEEAYKRHLFVFNKFFLAFICHSLDSSEPSNLVQEVEEVECSGVTKDKHVEEPQNSRGGRHDTPNVEVEV
jgi:hypothetical protein